MHPTHLVGIHGLKRTGKDTFARMLVEELPMGTHFKIMAYADHLKDITSVVFQIPRDRFDGDDKDTPLKEHGMSSLRDLLCQMADAVKAVRGGMYFRDHVVKEYIENPTHSVFVVTDVRYDYEADWIRENGGSVVCITRPLSTTSPSQHSSEAGITTLPEDYMVINDGSLDELRTKVQAYIALYGVGHSL